MKRNLLFALLALLPILLLAQPGQISLPVFSSGFNEPIFLTHAGDDRIFVVEKDGKIFIMDQNGVKNPTPFLDIDARVNSVANERGLLGLAFHPDYQYNGYFYLNYTNTAGHTVISRFSVSANPDIADVNSEEILLTINQPYSNHNGGCIQFGQDGYLYIGMGDGGSAGDPGNRSQDGNELLGKMLRLDVSYGLPYGIPSTNPYVGNAAVLDEIWALGVRNPWRFSFDRVSGDCWIGDVGQNNWEEIDFWPANGLNAAKNFGWRCYEGNVAYNTGGCQPQNTYHAPIFVYNHNQNNCSVTGGIVYRGARHQSLWGYYFHADYCSGLLWHTSSNGAGGWTTNQIPGAFSTFNLVSFGEDYFGELYLCGGSNGNIYRLSDTTCTPNAYIHAQSDTMQICASGPGLEAFGGPNLSYQWQLAGSDISGATSQVYLPSSSGDYRVIVSNGSCSDTCETVYAQVNAVPQLQVEYPSSNFCDSDTSTYLPIVLSHPGGNFYGNGIQGMAFHPIDAGIGSTDLIYVVHDPASGCVLADTLTMLVEICPAIQEPKNQLTSVSPNPNEGRFSLVVPEMEASYQIELSDMQGSQLKTWTFEANGRNRQMDFELADLPAGIYMLQINSDNLKEVHKLVIQAR